MPSTGPIWSASRRPAPAYDFLLQSHFLLQLHCRDERRDVRNYSALQFGLLLADALRTSSPSTDLDRSGREFILICAARIGGR